MPTLLHSAVAIAVSEYTPTRSGIGAWGDPVNIADSALLPNVGEFVSLAEDRLVRITAIQVDFSGENARVVLYGARVKQPGSP